MTRHNIVAPSEAEPTTKDFELELRVRNNRLKERRLALGLSAPQLAKEIGISYHSYITLESMHVSPIGRKAGFLALGEERVASWRKSALKIAAFYCVPPEVLWTDAILAVKAPRVVAQVDGGTLMAIAGATTSEWLITSGRSTADTYDATETLTRAKKVISRLPLREQQVLYQRFGLGEDGRDHTLTEIGERLGVCKERVRQHEASGLKHLRSALREQEEPESVLIVSVTPVEEESDDDYDGATRICVLWNNGAARPRVRCHCGFHLFRRSLKHKSHYRCAKCRSTFLVELQ